MKTRRTGSALTILMVIILLAAGVASALVWVSQQTAFGTVRVLEYLKAQAYAEAGANFAYSVLKDHFSDRNDPSKFPAGSFGDGSYSLTVVGISNDLASITSVGRCRRATYTVMADIKNFGTGSVTNPASDPANPFGYAVVSGGAQNWSGSGTLAINGANIHGNGQFRMTGSGNVQGSVSSSTKIQLTGSSKILGDGSAPTISASAGAITGTRTVGPVPNVAMPDIDFSPYYAEALRNGQVKASSFTYSGSADLVIPGGVLWVNGNFKFSGSGRIIGCIVATGNIDISGSGDQVKVGDLPALMSRDGNIDISGSGKFHGLMYAKTGSFRKSGSGDVKGSIMCAGEFTKTGSWSLMDYEDSTPLAPGSTPTSGDDVRITAWQK